MAVKKFKVGKALNFLSAILALAVVVGFFCFPVFTHTVKILSEEKTTSVTVLDLANVGFKADEDVSEKIVELTKDKKTEAAEKMTLALALREGEETNFGFNFALIAGFVALGAGILVCLFSVLSIYAKAGKINRLCVAGLSLSGICTFVGVLLMKNNVKTTALGSLASSSVAFGFGTYVILACAILSLFCVLIANSKKYSK